MTVDEDIVGIFTGDSIAYVQLRGVDGSIRSHYITLHISDYIVLHDNYKAVTPSLRIAEQPDPLLTPSRAPDHPLASPASSQVQSPALIVVQVWGGSGRLGAAE